MKIKTGRIALLGLGVAVAMILSYIEFLLPPVWSAVPGIKLGLPNIIIVYLFYKSGAFDAGLVSLVRIFLSALLFGNTVSMLYSISGAVLSFSLMLLLKKIGVFSTVGVSIGGAVFHNFGQILMAMMILRTREIGYYMIVLAISGVISGTIIGLLGAGLLKSTEKIKLFNQTKQPSFSPPKRWK